MARQLNPDAVQLSLFELPTTLQGPARLVAPETPTPSSSLDAARFWFRVYLESEGHPKNTVASYTNDLAVLESQVGRKAIKDITAKDIGRFLETARRRSTRKRRLTSIREFYSYLIARLGLQLADPAETFFPERIPLKTPVPLFASEQTRLLDAAAADGDRSYLMVYLMLELGVNRTELLQLRKSHVDLSVPDAPSVYIHYDDPRWRHKERQLQADARLTDPFQRYSESLPEDTLFPMLPQSVNAIVHRLARDAALERSVTPQTLRDTFAVEQARKGMGEDDLLRALGLASDPRNKDSVRRYIRLASPAVEVTTKSAD